MSIGPWQIAILIVLIVLLFGRGKISELMGDMAKGIKSFKKGLSEEDDSEDAKRIAASETRRDDSVEREKKSDGGDSA